jgi:uncharacterized repeat protein (TIGR02059 family)
MTWTTVQKAPPARTVGTDTQTATFPGTCTAGNLLVAIITQDGTPAIVNSLSGWNAAAESTYTNHARCTVYYKVSAGTETNIVVTTTSSCNLSVSGLEYSGNISTGAMDTAATGLASGQEGSPMVASSITTTTAGCLILAILADFNANGIPVFGNTWTQSFVQQQLGIFTTNADRKDAPAGTYNPSETVNIYPAYAGVTLAFRPAVGDTTAPVVVSRVVNGSTLTITYDETLSTSHTPAASAFTVTVAGATRSISNIVVSGATVVLTLSSPVVSGQTVTLTYVP